MKRREILKNLSVVPLAGVIGNNITGPEKNKAKKEWTPLKEAVPGVYPTTSPLSLCIRSGHFVFLSGIGGWYANRRSEPGDIKVQIESALTDMKNQLEKAGTSMSNVLKVHMTLADPNKNLAPLNEVYGKFFPDPKPARSFSGAGIDQMGRDGVLVQIDCIAYID
jgi:enamine deaminase RidA (YjgF/YER057c/UK114 family)